MKTKIFFMLCLIMSVAIIKLSGQSSKNSYDNKTVKYSGVYSDYLQPVYCDDKKVDNLSDTFTFSDSTQNYIEKSRSQRGFYLGALYSVIKNPTFRSPGPSGSGGEEIAVNQSASSLGFLAGYQYDFGKFGLGARAIYWHASFEDYTIKETFGAGAQPYVNYTEPAFTHISFDLLVEWIPMKKFYLGIYGLLGMASSTESYNISGAIFPEWDGHKSLTEFDYSYGLGIKISPLKWVSVIVEIRWIPGDATYDMNGTTIGKYTYYTIDPYDTGHIENFTKIFSAGLSFHFGTDKSKNKF